MSINRSIFFGLTSVLVLGLGFSSQSVAAGKQFENAFRNVACNNGWVACLVDGDEITVDSISDSRGIFHPSNSRVSFFDFEPLEGHSPFDMVDAYPAVVAEVVPEPEPEVEQPIEKVKKPRPTPVAKVEKVPEPEPVPEPEVVPEPEPVPEPEVVPEPEPVPEPEVALSQSGCDDLMLLEGSAMMGELSGADKTCLEAKINSKIPLTEKRDVSLLLINNAEASRDMSEWSRLVGRHLQRYDQSDPVVCMRYAYYLSKKVLVRQPK